MCRLDTRPGEVSRVSSSHVLCSFFLRVSLFTALSLQPRHNSHHGGPLPALASLTLLPPAGRKVSIRVGANQYIQHWRHVQYSSNLEMAALFFTSAEYAKYMGDGGRAFKEDIFYQARCKCITQSDFEECSCPHCTIWRESVRSYHRSAAPAPLYPHRTRTVPTLALHTHLMCTLCV